MRYDFSQVEDVQDFVAVPNGSYVCRVAEVRERRARDGAERWSIRWVVEEGVFAGRTAAWDNLTWSERGIRRVKYVLAKLGETVAGVIDIDPQSLVGKVARVTVFAEEFVNPATGARQVRARVPYAGYEPASPAPRPDDGAPEAAATAADASAGEEEEEAPF